MKKMHALAVFVICTLALQVFTISSWQGVTNNSQHSIENTPQQLIEDTPPMESVELSGAGGEDPLVTNVYSNRGFEEFESNGQPMDWAVGGNSYAIANGSYQDIVNTGSYSGLLETQGTAIWSGDVEFYKSYSVQPYPYLSQDVTMETY